MMEPFMKMNSLGWDGQSVVDRLKGDCAHPAPSSEKD